MEYLGTETEIIQVSKNQKIESNCKAIMIKNLGDATLTINNIYTLEQGEVFIVGQDAGSIDLSTYNLSFGAGTVTNAAVVRTNPVKLLNLQTGSTVPVKPFC